MKNGQTERHQTNSHVFTMHWECFKTIFEQIWRFSIFRVCAPTAVHACVTNMCKFDEFGIKHLRSNVAHGAMMIASILNHHCQHLKVQIATLSMQPSIKMLMMMHEQLHSKRKFCLIHLKFCFHVKRGRRHSFQLFNSFVSKFHFLGWNALFMTQRHLHLARRWDCAALLRCDRCRSKM